MTDTTTKRLQEAIDQVIQTQIHEKTPPETRETLLRLMQEGHSEQQALRLIGHVVAAEVFGVMRQSQPFDEERYIQRLHKLPSLPWQKGV